MGIQELEELMREQGISVCPICHMPFEPYHSRQKTCGKESCKREYKNAYLRERRKELKESDPDGFRRYHADAQRKYRKKKRANEAVMKNLEEYVDNVMDVYERQKNISGLDYGQRSAEKLLKSIPKINTDLGQKK